LRAYFKIQSNNKTPFSFTLFVQGVTIFVIRKPGMQEKFNSFILVSFMASWFPNEKIPNKEARNAGKNLFRML
jgi:hypothetical protein